MADQTWHGRLKAEGKAIPTTDDWNAAHAHLRAQGIDTEKFTRSAETTAALTKYALERAQRRADRTTR